MFLGSDLEEPQLKPCCFSCKWSGWGCGKGEGKASTKAKVWNDLWWWWSPYPMPWPWISRGRWSLFTNDWDGNCSLVKPGFKLLQHTDSEISRLTDTFLLLEPDTRSLWAEIHYFTGSCKLQCQCAAWNWHPLGTMTVNRECSVTFS